LVKTNGGILIVLALVVLGLFLFFGGGELQTFASLGLEEQQKLKHITYWADETDGKISTSLTPCNPSGKFTCEGGGVITSNIPSQDGILVRAGEAVKNGVRIFDNPVLTTTKKFSGQEVAIVLNGGSNEFGFCDISPAGAFSGTRKLIEYKPHTFSSGGQLTYDLVNNGLKTGEFTASTDGFPLQFTCQGISTQGSGNGIVEYIGFSAQFECDLSSDEVWIQEVFAESFNIEDLEFIPTKFCHETRPFVLRRLDEGEKPIRKEEGIQVLNTGGIIPASLTDLVTANYAAFFVEGVTSRCAENQANVKVGDIWVCKNIIEPLQIIVQCETSSDCPQPLKNLCPDFFKGCQNNFCVYNQEALNAPVCKNEVVTIIKEIEKIQERELIVVTGANLFLFSVSPSASFNFGDKKFVGSADFTCEILDGTTTFPNPNPDCWQGTASFEGKDFDIKDGESFFIRDNINVTYFAGGSVLGRQDCTQDEDGVLTCFIESTEKKVSADFIFEIIGNPIELNVGGGSEVLKDSDGSITIVVKNNLPIGTVLLKINEIAKKTNQIFPEQRIETKLNEGDNTLSFDFDTTNLGIHEITIQTFYKMEVAGIEILLPSNKIVFNMNVVNELSGLNPEIITITKVITETEEKIIVVEKEGIPTIVKVLGGVLAFIIALALIP